MITIYYAVSALQSEACKLTEKAQGKTKKFCLGELRIASQEWPGWQKE